MNILIGLVTAAFFLIIIVCALMAWEQSRDEYINDPFYHEKKNSNAQRRKGIY